MKGKTTAFLFLIAFVLAFVVLAAAQGGNNANNFGKGGFGKGGFGKGGGGNGGKNNGGGGQNNGGGGQNNGGGGQNNGGQNNGGQNNGGQNNGGGGQNNGGGGQNNGGGGNNVNQPPPPGGNNNNNDNAQICNNGKFGIADGTQQQQSTCVITQMGQLPTFNNMVASMIVSPQDRQTIQANTPFDIKVAVANMETGFFSDAAKQYYTESQQLNAQGLVQGHSHITIQQVQPNQAQPADARNFAFFEGLNDPAQNGILSTVCPGLAKGFYRACTMTSSFTHQPVLMPVAKRGTQDDCVRFSVK